LERKRKVRENRCHGGAGSPLRGTKHRCIVDSWWGVKRRVRLKRISAVSGGVRGEIGKKMKNLLVPKRGGRYLRSRGVGLREKKGGKRRAGDVTAYVDLKGLINGKKGCKVMEVSIMGRLGGNHRPETVSRSPYRNRKKVESQRASQGK